LSRATATGTLQAIARWLMTLLGVALTALGLVTFWLPLPVGVPLLLLGALVLIRYSMLARRALARANRHYPAFRRFYRQTRSLRRRIGVFLSRQGRRRRPVRSTPD
jgi:uncharacterized membrane protein YbaN (DUF454 family)